MATWLARRVHGAIKNREDMRAMRLELTAATHFARCGCAIAWPDHTKDDKTFDQPIKDVGVGGLEVECKSISEDQGRKFHRYDALDFYHLAWPYLKEIRNGLETGVSAVITVPNKLPNQYKDCLGLAKQWGNQLRLMQNTTLPDGTSIKITEFDTASLGHKPAASTPRQMRSALDELIETNNRSGLIVGTRVGGVMILMLQGKNDKSFLNAVFAALFNLAKKQLTGARAAVFVVGFDGLDCAQLLSIANQDQDPSQPPSGRQLAASKFLANQNRDNLIGVGFVAMSRS